ncbi:hypothetical protein [Streptomyces brasiliscabiei]|uniref:hypothetical protein n=1 Tax=Streptomyces brasiliscabiei TaxID=2736302 RepID=UPI0038F73097
MPSISGTITVSRSPFSETVLRRTASAAGPVLSSVRTVAVGTVARGSTVTLTTPDGQVTSARYGRPVGASCRFCSSAGLVVATPVSLLSRMTSSAAAAAGIACSRTSWAAGS